ncbi:MAG: N-methyl-L-tryptophan oxidase [Bryobacterales bacterium]|nr:N-methyl-L-tryptophan oxidase [Bryobacterales bacterium]
MFDAIVIGIGGVGSAPVYHLARAGCKVLGLEQFGIPNRQGSSHGSTRIIRLAYTEGPEYVPLLRAAYRYWREIGSASGESIMRTTGGLDIGAKNSWTVRGSRQSCMEHGIEFEELEAGEVNGRFQGYHLPPSMNAVYHTEGGYLLSEVAIAAYASEARKHGAEIHSDETVQRWNSSSHGLRVVTNSREYRTKRLVVTAGAWVGRLCPALRTVCKPERQVMLWTTPVEAEAFTPSRFPVFNLEAPTGRYYGFPDHNGEGFKIGKYHHLKQALENPDELDRSCHPEDESVLREGIREYFPLANGATRRMAACMFTNTPDSDFVLDRVPGEENVYVATGFSGHGFKFCSVVGKIMAEHCLQQEPSWDIGRFRLQRVRTTNY